MKIAIYAPYLSVYGGGEKYMGKIAEILSKERENDVELIVLTQPDIRQLQSALNIDLSRVGIKYPKVPSLFSKVPYLRLFVNDHAISKVTEGYDLFLNQQHFSAIPSFAKRSILICEVPPKRSSNLLQLLAKLLRNLFFDPKLRTYDKVLTNSCYTQKWIKRHYEKEVEVLYPPIDTEAFFPLSKQNIILSVGRFFVGGHNKRQREMIRFFKELYKGSKTFTGWEYHLIGRADVAVKSQEYLKICQDEAKNCPIFFHINAPFNVLKELYGRAKIFWHATGLHEDESRHPDRMEHFGIATVEAMSAGCVPVVINKGGQPEIVRSKIDGFLWDTVEQLKEYTFTLVTNDHLWQEMSQSSIKRSQEFNIEKFTKKLKQILEL